MSHLNPCQRAAGLLVLAVLVAGWGARADPPEAKPTTVELTFGKSYIPVGLKAGDRVHLKQVLSARLKATGKVDIQSQDLLRDLEVDRVTVVEKPSTPGQAVTVAFRVSGEQAGQFALIKKSPPFQLVRKNLARDSVKRTELKAESLDRWGGAEAVFTARLVQVEAMPVAAGGWSTSHRLQFEVERPLSGPVKKGDKVAGRHLAQRREKPTFPEGKTCLVALTRRGPGWEVRSARELSAEDLAQAKLACAVPVGWTLRDGWLVSPWGDLGDDIWPADQIPKTTLACSRTGRPALLAGEGVELKAEAVPPKDKIQRRNPEGDGQFRVTVKNVSRVPIAIPALLTDGKQTLWAQSLVIISRSESRAKGAGKRTYESTKVLPNARAGRGPVQATVLKPGEEASTTIDILKVPGLIPRLGSGRIELRFALGEKQAAVPFFYSSYHRRLQRELPRNKSGPREG